MSDAAIPLIHRLYGLSRPLRRRRMRRFLSLFPAGEILDVGGTASTWDGWGREVTVLNAMWAMVTHPTPDYMDRISAELRLLSRGEFRALFPPDMNNIWGILQQQGCSHCH